MFRIYDNILATGIEAIFGFALALLKRSEEQLLKLKFDDILEYMRNKLFEAYRVGIAMWCSLHKPKQSFRLKMMETGSFISLTNSSGMRVLFQLRRSC